MCHCRLERLSGELLEGLGSGRIDAAFAWTPPTEGLVTHRLHDDELVVVLPANHALAKTKNAISLSALSGETFIIYGRRDGFGLFAATIVACRAVGFSPRFGLEAPRLASALSLAAAGFGIFFVPASIQPSSDGRGRVSCPQGPSQAEIHFDSCVTQRRTISSRETLRGNGEEISKGYFSQYSSRSHGATKYLANVRYWHLADIGLCAAHVCL